jgi:tRNA uridine 5-carbamoylmethylation protein Kti12
MQKCEIKVMVGVPGSGKSSIIEKIIKADGYELDSTNQKNYCVISTDDIIEREAEKQGKTYNELWETSIKEATKQANETFRLMVAERRNLIWDQTNLVSKKRKAILSQLPKEYYKTAIYVTAPYEIIKERLVKRELETGKRISVGILDNMLTTFEMPSLEEGFDKVIIFNSHTNTIGE